MKTQIMRSLLRLVLVFVLFVGMVGPLSVAPAPQAAASPLSIPASTIPDMGRAATVNPAAAYNLTKDAYLALPSPDGRTLFVSGTGSPYPLYDLETGDVVQSFDYPDWTRHAVFTPDSSQLLIGHILYDVATGAPVKVLANDCAGAAKAGDISPDGTQALLMCDTVVQRFDLVTGAELQSYDIRALTGNGRSVGTAVFSPDMGQIAVSSDRHGSFCNAWILDTAAGTVLHAFNRNIFDIAFSPDGQYILTGGSESYLGTTYLWDSSTYSMTVAYPAYGEGVWDVAFSSDGSMVAAGGYFTGLFVWETTTGNQVSNINYTGRGVGRTVDGLAFSADDATVFYASRNGWVQAFDTQSGDHHRAYHVAYPGWEMIHAKLSSSGDQVLIGGDDLDGGEGWDLDGRYNLTFYDAEAFAFRGALQDDIVSGDSQSGSVYDVAYAPNGETVLVSEHLGGEGAAVAIHETPGGERVHMLISGCGYQSAPCGTFWSVTYSPDGTLAAAADDRGRVYVWDAASGLLLKEIDYGIHAKAPALTIDPANSLVAVGLHPDLYVFDLTTGTSVFNASTGNVWAAQFSPDGSQLAVGTAGDSVLIYDTTNWDLLYDWTGLHGGSIFTLDYSEDGAYLLTGGYDATAKVWDIAAETLLVILEGHTGAVTDAVFYPDGEHVLTGSGLEESAWGYDWADFDARVYKWSLNDILDVSREPVTPIVPDTVYSETAPPLGWRDFVLTTSPGASLLITATATLSDGLRLYGRYAGQPNFALSDARALHATARGDYALLLPAVQPGSLYIGVFGDEVAGGNAPFTLRASYVDRYVADFTPAVAGNAGPALVQLSGIGFEADMDVGLCQSGAVIHAADPVTSQGDDILLAQFDFTGATTGVYDLCVDWSDGDRHVLPSAFTLVEGSGGRLEAELTVPSAFRPARAFPLRIRYENVGDSDLVAPLLLLSNDDGAPMKSVCHDRWSTGTLQLLGTSTFGDVGVLPPGGSGEALAFFQGTDGGAHEFVNFELRTMEPTDEIIDWADFRDGMRPPDWTEGEWNTVFPTLTTQLGGTWAEYFGVLGANARRLHQRGASYQCVQDLLHLELLRAQGEPTAAIAGQILDTETGQQVKGTNVVAYDYDDADNLVARAEPSSWIDGGFILDGLPAGDYRLDVEGYTVTAPLTVTIADDNDVTGLLVYAAPDTDAPDEAEGSYALPSHDPDLTVDDLGQGIVTYQRGDEVWTARYDPAAGAWQDAAALPNVGTGLPGNSPDVTFGPAVAEGNPGLTAVWRQGYGREGTLHYAVAAQQPDQTYAWSEPLTLTHDAYGDFAPAVTVLDDGDPLVLWLQEDFAVGDDSDLYYAQVDVPGTLHLFFADEMGETVTVEIDTTSLPEVCTGVNLKTGKSLPKWIPLVGGKYGFKVSGEACAETGCDLNLSSGVNVELDLSDRFSAAGSANVAGTYKTDPQSCIYVFDQATAGITVSGKGKIPVSTFSILFAEAEVGVTMGGSIKGEAQWKGGGLTRMPDSGTVDLTATAGGYGKADFWFSECELNADFGVTAQYTAPSSYAFKGWCFTAGFGGSDEGNAKRGKSVGLSKSWGPACGDDDDRNAFLSNVAVSSQGFVSETTTIIDGVPVTERMVMDVVAQVGTGNVYPGVMMTQTALMTPAASGVTVLDDVSHDLTDDGPPALAHSAGGETLVAWTKDAQDQSVTLGSRVVVATYNGSDWDAPVIVQGDDRYNDLPELAFTGAITPLMVWSSADATGVSLSSTITELLDAEAATDIYFSRRAGGVWDTPQPIATLAGPDTHPQFASDGTGHGVAVWRHGEAALYAAFWDGATWSAAASVPHVTGNVDSLDVAYVVSGTQTLPLLTWAQDVDGDPARNDDLTLVSSLWDGSTWRAPALVHQPPAPVSRRVALSAPLPTCLSGGLAPAWLGTSPPSSCCTEPGGGSKPQPPAGIGGSQGSTLAGSGQSERILPNDPNEKVGLGGLGSQHHVAAGETLKYTVFFENVITATAPAQVVVITDVLDSDLDWESVRFTEVAFGDEAAAVSEDGRHFDMRLPHADYRAEVDKTWWVDVNGNLNPDTGQITWQFTTLDPETGELPLDVYAGFLPPNDTSGRGEGHVSFAVDPVPDAPKGTVITNQASIVFDTNDPIFTNVYVNVIGVEAVYLPVLLR